MIPPELFEQWLKTKGLKDRTIENYFYYFNKFQALKFNQESVSRFLAEKANRNLVAKSFLKNLKECILRNHQELKIDNYYYKEINDVYIPGVTGTATQRLINPLTEQQILLLEKHLRTEELKLMLLTCYYAGLRLGELDKITITSFNWDEWRKNIEVIGEVRVYGKGDKEGIALLPSSMMKRIAKFIRENTKKYKGVNSRLFFLGKSSFQKALNVAGIKSNITQLNPDGTKVKSTSLHPHRLRHSRAYNLMISNVDIRYIQELLRHQSIQSTQIYTKLSKQDLKNKLEEVNQNAKQN